MKLSSYLEWRGQTQREFGERVNANASTICRVASGEHVPGPQLIARIYVETDGHVTPNDFYDLPYLPNIGRNNKQTSTPAQGVTND